MDLSWVELDQLNKEKTVMLIGAAPIEEHGRHLPTGVDVYETEYWIENSIKKLEMDFKGYIFLTMPVITYGHASLEGIPGSIHLTQELFYSLMSASLEAIAEWGIKHIVVISGHADPKHLIAIEQACEKLNEKQGVTAFAPMGAIFSEKVELSTDRQFINMYNKLEEYPKDFHAGWIETSYMLEIKSKLVKENYLEQPDIIVNGKDMMYPKEIMSKTAGFGHLGYPKEASAKLGRELNASMTQKIVQCVSAFINRKDYQQYEHHELYKIPSLKALK
jgi:creatinine amidohydrolase